MSRPSYLITVDVQFADTQHNYSTDVNGDNSTDDELREYFVGTEFDMGRGYKNGDPVEEFHKCTGIVIHR